jgi:hypothetical protein
VQVDHDIPSLYFALIFLYIPILYGKYIISLLLIKLFHESILARTIFFISFITIHLIWLFSLNLIVAPFIAKVMYLCLSLNIHG